LRHYAKHRSDCPAAEFGIITPVGTCQFGPVLFGNAGGHELGGIDDRKTLGIVTALQHNIYLMR
jgi:hypothetical protein